MRRLGIPTVADRVVQAALKLVLEPIFEADFAPVSYGFRPRRRAHDAIAEIHLFGTKGLRALTHRTSLAELGTTLTTLNQILRGWAVYFRHAVATHTFKHL